MINRLYNIFFALLALISFVGCGEDIQSLETSWGSDDIGGLQPIQSTSFEIFPYNSTKSVVESYDNISNLTAFIFESDTLTQIISDLEVEEASSGVVNMQCEAHPLATVILLSGIDSSTIKATCNTTSLSDFRALGIGGQNGAMGAYPIYCGEVSFNRLVNGSEAITMERLISRVDLNVTEGGYAITAVRLYGVATTTTIQSDSSYSANSADVNINSINVTSSRIGQHYLYNATYSSAATVEVYIEMSSGATSTLKATLPTMISSNKIYTFNVSKSAIEITSSDWGYTLNDSSNSDYDLTTQIVVDSDSTTDLPDGVAIQDGGATIAAPYLASSFEITIKSDVDIELYNAPGCDVEEVSSNRFRITLGRSVINNTNPDIKLFIRRKNLTTSYNEYITVAQSENPIKVSGTLAECIQEITSKFESSIFVDNELLSIDLPAGYSIAVESDDSSRQWLRCVESNGKYIIQGGFRPNDIESNGITESGRIIFTTDSGVSDIYEISRINWGIPVIWFNGNYWSKFNLRGNPNSYEDQLRVSDPIASETDLYSYLKTCSTEDFYKVAGDAYVGQLSTPLTLAPVGSSKLFSDYSYEDIPNAHINNTAAEYNTPDGFRRPSWDDFNAIFMAGTLTLSMTNGETNGVYTNAANDTHISYRQTVHGYTGVCSIYNMIKFTSAVAANSSEPIVFTGYGTQWSDTGYSVTLNMYPAYYDTIPNDDTYFMWTNGGTSLQTKRDQQPYYSTYYIRAVKSTVAFTY